MTVVVNLGGTIALSYRGGRPTEVGVRALVGRGIRVVDVAPTSSNALTWCHLTTLRDTLLAHWRAGERRFLVTVGTDALEEVLYFLSLVRPPGVRTAVAGAFRPRSAPRSDGLACASLALQWLEADHGGGVAAACGGRLIRGARVAKIFSDGWRFQLCSPADDGLSAWTLDERRTLLKRAPRVPLLPIGVDSGAWLAQVLQTTRVDGVVFEGFGPGDVPPTLVGTIRRLLSRRIPVVLASRSTPGRVEPAFPGVAGASHGLLASGVLGAGALAGVHARIRLLVALAARPPVPAASAFAPGGNAPC